MKPLQILKSCLNPKVLIGVVALIILAYLFVPQIANFSWILIALICPISMMLMMVGMNRKDEGDKESKVFVCSECGYQYKEAELAKRCSAWCKEHNSCNLEIIKHGIPPKHEN